MEGSRGGELGIKMRRGVPGASLQPKKVGRMSSFWLTGEELIAMDSDSGSPRKERTSCNAPKVAASVGTLGNG